MLSEGKNPEDATRLFHLALERVQSKQYDDAEQYFGLSIDYELRPITFLELAKLRLLRDSPPVRALKDIEEGLKLCSDRNEHVQVRNELLSLKANFIEPLIAERERILAEEKQRKATIRALAVAGEFQQALNFVDLADGINDLKDLALPSLRMKLGEHHDGRVCSKFGGIPDVPPGFDWPLVDCDAVAPLEFLCQLDLSEIRNIWSDSELPSSGMLSFFADASNFEFSGDPSAWKVFFFENKSLLMPARRPSSDAIWDDFPEETYPACSVVFEHVNTLPHPRSKIVRAFSMCDEDQEKYDELVVGWQGDSHGNPTHQLLGHPQLIQQDIFSDCEDELERFSSKYQKQFSKLATDFLVLNEWCLLLQIDSDDVAKFSWGDSGKLYFCIRKGDLAARIFTGVVLIGQCF